MKSDINFCNKALSHIQNDKPYETIGESPLKLNTVRQGRKKSENLNDTSFQNVLSDSSKDSDSDMIPEPITPILKSRKCGKPLCSICSKGFNMRSKVVDCNTCREKFHIKCAKPDEDMSNVCAGCNVVDTQIEELIVDVVNGVPTSSIIQGKLMIVFLVRFSFNSIALNNFSC